jgi:hypothetical protein
MKRLVIAFLLLGSAVHAQSTADRARTQAGCGPSDVNFEVTLDKKHRATPQAAAGKAIVYFVQQDVTDPGFMMPNATLKVGADGSWVGGTHGKSYLFFPVEPGDHRVCTSWQSIAPWVSKLGAAITINAEAGKMYYVRATVEERKEHPNSVKLELIDSAEGLFAISKSGLSISHPSTK